MTTTIIEFCSELKRIAILTGETVDQNIVELISVRWLSVQYVRAAVHQLHQRASTAVLQSSHVRPRAGRVQEGRYSVGVH